ncbi:MAG: CBS domain-containing protein [Streptosporangiaceae bacterium]
MSREDYYLDSMLRHLGAAYYDSLHGKAGDGDVRRAVDRVAGELGKKSAERAETHAHGRPASDLPRHHGPLHSRVRDLMTADVISVDRNTAFKDVAGLLVENDISGVPVLWPGRQVTGVVTEGDLITAKDKRAGTEKNWMGAKRYASDHSRYLRLTAAELMTSPAVTIHPDATIASAARVMRQRHVKRLPVVDPSRNLIGLVSRHDLLKVFLVPDEEIVREVRELLAEHCRQDASEITVAAHGGIVSLTGHPAGPPEAVARAIELTWEIDGVVDILNHLRQKASQTA